MVVNSPKEEPLRDSWPSRRLEILRVLLLVLAAEGVIATALSLGTPSMERRAVALGYSLERIAATSFFLLACAVMVAVALWRPSRRGRRQPLLDRAVSRLETDPRALVSSASFLFYAFTVGSYALLLLKYEFTPHPNLYLLHVAVDRLSAPLVWLTLVPLQALLTILFAYRRDLRAALRMHGSFAILVLSLICTATSLHWVTLALQAEWLHRIPGWFWYFQLAKPLRASHLWILLAGVAAGTVAYVGAGSRGRGVWSSTLTLLAIAYVLQIGFGFALGEGFESIRRKYTGTPLSDQAFLACEERSDIPEVIRNYEEKYGDSFWYGAKPPGLVAFYLTTKEIVRSIYPFGDRHSCFFAVSSFASVLMPFLACLVVLPILGIQGLLGDRSGPWIAAPLFYFSAPNVLLMALVPDQFLYPVVFSAVALALMWAMLRPGLARGILAGLALYIALFVSFSTLPLLGFWGAWVALGFLSSQWRPRFLRAWPSLVGIAVGFAACLVAGNGLLGYDPLSRCRNAFEHHRGIMQFAFTPDIILRSSVVNNLEFAMWSGLPLLLLALFGCIRALRSFLLGTPTLTDLFAISLALTYVALNVLGQTRGEVGRVWLVLLPSAAVVASRESQTLLRGSRLSVLAPFLLQFITSSFAFFFFDWR